MTYGIDYSGRTNANRDPETGIRYGIIPMGSVSWDDACFDSEYDPTCPNCGRDLPEEWESETTPEEWAHAKGIEVSDIAPDDLERLESVESRICLHCLHAIGDGEEYGEEPTRTVIGDACDESGFMDSSGDIWVTESPYYTHARFCSPCAPGACYLTDPTDEGGPRAYCLGPEWFDEDTPCPYPIYRVSDGSRVG